MSTKKAMTTTGLNYLDRSWGKFVHSRKVWSLILLIFIFLVVVQGIKGTRISDYDNKRLFQYAYSNFKISDDKKILVVFDSGGWGNTPVEKANDFGSVINGVKKTLNDMGYSVVVVSYNRTKNGFLGKLNGLEEIIDSFKFQSNQLADQIEHFLKNRPKSDVVMIGLCTGGGFVNETMRKISYKFKSRVYAIEAGVPFWIDSTQSRNIIKLDNNGRDSLATGQLGVLTLSLLKAPERWFLAKIKGENISLPYTINAPGHKYSWKSPEVGPKIVSFLETKFAHSKKSKNK